MSGGGALCMQSPSSPRLCMQLTGSTALPTGAAPCVRPVPPPATSAACRCKRSCHCGRAASPGTVARPTAGPPVSAAASVKVPIKASFSEGAQNAAGVVSVAHSAEDANAAAAQGGCDAALVIYSALAQRVLRWRVSVRVQRVVVWGGVAEQAARERVCRVLRLQTADCGGGTRRNRQGFHAPVALILSKCTRQQQTHSACRKRTARSLLLLGLASPSFSSSGLVLHMAPIQSAPVLTAGEKHSALAGLARHKRSSCANAPALSAGQKERKKDLRPSPGVR